eukprot:g8174.t1
MATGTLAFALQKTWVLQAATLGPLALATVPEDSSLLALSSTLALTLAGMTFTRPAGVAFDAAVEKAAVSSNLLTTPTNRAVRLLFGAISIVAALRFLRRTHAPIADAKGEGHAGRAAMGGAYQLYAFVLALMPAAMLEPWKLQYRLTGERAKSIALALAIAFKCSCYAV